MYTIMCLRSYLIARNRNPHMLRKIHFQGKMSLMGTSSHRELEIVSSSIHFLFSVAIQCATSASFSTAALSCLLQNDFCFVINLDFPIPPAHLGLWVVIIHTLPSNVLDLILPVSRELLTQSLFLFLQILERIRLAFLGHWIESLPNGFLSSVGEKWC